MVSCILIPNIITAVKDKNEGLLIAVLITKAKSPIKERIAPAKWVKPLIGSLR